jgi:hypothetical protein
MTDIPDAAVKAAIEARYNHGTDPQPYNPGRCRCGANLATAVEQLEHATRRELEAALKHLQPHTLPPLVPSWAFVVPAERPYETTLSDDSEPGDLG